MNSFSFGMFRDMEALMAGSQQGMAQCIIFKRLCSMDSPPWTRPLPRDAKANVAETNGSGAPQTSTKNRESFGLFTAMSNRLKGDPLGFLVPVFQSMVGNVGECQPVDFLPVQVLDLVKL